MTSYDNMLINRTLDKLEAITALTKREQFAMAAMQGLLSKSGITRTDLAPITEASCEIADALIAELDKELTND